MLRRKFIRVRSDPRRLGLYQAGNPLWPLEDCCMTSINRHLLPSRNSLHSTSTLLDVTLKALRLCQATACKFARLNARARVPFEGNFQSRS